MHDPHTPTPLNPVTPSAFPFTTPSYSSINATCHTGSPSLPSHPPHSSASLQWPSPLPAQPKTRQTHSPQPHSSSPLPRPRPIPSSHHPTRKNSQAATQWHCRAVQKSRAARKKTTIPSHPGPWRRLATENADQDGNANWDLRVAEGKGCWSSDGWVARGARSRWSGERGVRVGRMRWWRRGDGALRRIRRRRMLGLEGRDQLGIRGSGDPENRN